MVNPSLKELPGIPPSYIGFLEGISRQDPGQTVRPEKELLLSRCRNLLNGVPPAASFSQLVGKDAPGVPGSHLSPQHIERLESRSAVVIGASADVTGFGTALVPLLKCLTAIKLADEMSLGGFPAVPLLWLYDPASTRGDGDDKSVRLESQPTEIRPGPEAGLNLINYFSNEYKDLLKNNVKINSGRGIIALLVREFGPILIDSASMRSRLSSSEELEKIGPRVAGVSEGEGGKGTAPSDLGRGPVSSDGVIDLVLLTASVPLAAIVIGPEEYDTVAHFNHLFGSADHAKPLLWPRVSATIVDRRSCRIMEKFQLGLPDLLQGDKQLSERLGYGGMASDVLNRLESLAGTVRRRLDDISARSARDPRAVRRIRASGSRMLYQLRKLAVRSRQFADAHQDAASRQLENLCRQIAPAGELQERRLDAVQFLSAYPESALQALYRKIDVWNFNHQLIVGLD